MASRPVLLDSDTTRLYERWVKGIEARLDDPKTDRDGLCRDLLTEIHYGAQARYEEIAADPERPLAERVLVSQFDPRHVTLEAEYYAECDAVRFARVKPLLWLWIQFDHSPLGHNVHLGLLFRRALARRIFARCGRNLRVFRDVEVSFGYNISVGDDTTIHRKVLLDDRGAIDIGSRVSISDYANIYSHTHDIEEIETVRCGRTVIGDGARVTYHAVVLSGTSVGRNAMVGTMGVVTRPVPDHHINVGIPARTVKVKRSGSAQDTARPGAGARPVHE